MAATENFGKLFHLPVAIPIEGGSVSAGAKPYFYQTGTTTDLTVYSDGDLATSHAQPVVADSNGEFAAIYLNPDASTLYKVVLKDSSDATLWTVDPVSPRTEGFDTDTFTVTWNGFSADPSNTTATWFRFDRLIQIILPLGTGTSNATTFSLSGVPTAIRPATKQFSYLAFGSDNGSHQDLMAEINTDGTISFAPAGATYSESGWTNSGAKGILIDGAIWYRLSDS
jgi:hypothetical protein